jgi:hypothetical protein
MCKCKRSCELASGRAEHLPSLQTDGAVRWRCLNRAPRRTRAIPVQPEPRRPPPTECLRDSFPRDDPSAPGCTNFFPPRRSRFAMEASLFVLVEFFFLAMTERYANDDGTSISRTRLQTFLQSFIQSGAAGGRYHFFPCEPCAAGDFR